MAKKFWYHELSWDLLYLTPKQLLIALGCAIAFVIFMSLVGKRDPQDIRYHGYDPTKFYVVADREGVKVEVKQGEWSTPVCNAHPATHYISYQPWRGIDYDTLHPDGKVYAIRWVDRNRWEWAERSFMTDRPVPANCQRIRATVKTPEPEHFVTAVLLSRR